MNLHIVPDNVFINKFCDNLQELGILSNNRVIVRTNERKLKFIRHNLPFAKLYSPAFQAICGKTAGYDKVFIHQFTPLLYRWVATNDFRELNWMVWGADLYNLPAVKTALYEDLTLRKYVNRIFSVQDFLYKAKVLFLHDRFRSAAYDKVNNILTWMRGEYNFALRHLSPIQAKYQFFFYENQLPYQDLDMILSTKREINQDLPTYILGNSSTPELNHLDAVAWMEREGVRANLCVPVSYGDKRYAHFLKSRLSSFKGGKIQFVDHYMAIHQYLQFLNRSDGLIMNNIRPQGYGNIFMMMYLEKKVYLNEKNFSVKDLSEKGLRWLALKDLGEKPAIGMESNRSAVLGLLSHETLLKVYRELFS